MVTRTRATLLQQLRNGANVLAWDEFFDRYGGIIFGFARHRGCSEHTSEEIVQEVMLTVFNHREVYQYDPARGRFRDWLGTVVTNKVTEYRRRRANRLHGGGGDSDEGIMQQAAEQSGPDAAWERAFENDLLLALLAVVRREVSPRVYLAFELVVLQGLSGKEAARLSGLSRNAVYKARRRVQERLVELGAPYREEGQLAQQIKEALQQRPQPNVARRLTSRVRQTMDG